MKKEAEKEWKKKEKEVEKLMKELKKWEKGTKRKRHECMTFEERYEEEKHNVDLWDLDGKEADQERIRLIGEIQSFGECSRIKDWIWAFEIYHDELKGKDYAIWKVIGRPNSKNFTVEGFLQNTFGISKRSWYRHERDYKISGYISNIAALRRKLQDIKSKQ